MNNLPRKNVVRCLLMKSFLLCICALLLIPPSGLHADTRESWDLIESENFQVYYRGNTKSAQKVVDIAEAFYPKMRRLMDGMHLGKIEIWVCEEPSQFQAAVHAPIQDWAIGCAFPLSRRIIIQNPRRHNSARFSVGSSHPSRNRPRRLRATHQKSNRQNPPMVR